jgi:hypothetical protein
MKISISGIKMMSDYQENIFKNVTLIFDVHFHRSSS